MRCFSCCGLILLLGGAGCATVPPSAQVTPANRPALWVDSLRGEPLDFEKLLDELQVARVVYPGEIHSLPRHHDLQTVILDGLA